MKKLMFISAATLILWSCGSQNGKNTGSNENNAGEEVLTAEVDEGEEEVPVFDRTMLEDLPEDALKEIRHSIATSDTLTDVFFFQVRDREDSINPAAFKLMERMMQASFNYEGRYAYAYEWACQDTVATVFLEYLRKKDSSVTAMDSLLFRKVTNEIDRIVEYYYCGSQAAMNTASFIDMNMECYRAIGTYKDLMALTTDKQLRKAYFNDYIEWIDLFAAMDKRHEGAYSAYPLVINAFGAEIMSFRTKMLYEEMEFLRSGRPCTWDASKHIVDWDAEDADLLRPWYEKRMLYCDGISDRRFANSYRLMTDKIAYTYQNTITFGMQEEGY